MASSVIFPRLNEFRDTVCITLSGKYVCAARVSVNLEKFREGRYVVVAGTREDTREKKNPLRTMSEPTVISAIAYFSFFHEPGVKDRIPFHPPE